MKTSWSHTSNPAPFVTEYMKVGMQAVPCVGTELNKRAGFYRLTGLDIIAIHEAISKLPENERGNAFRAMPEPIYVPKNRNQLDCGVVKSVSPYSERSWSTASREYGALAPVVPPTPAHRLSTAKWYLPEHPFWTKQAESGPPYGGLESTYMDLGHGPRVATD